MRTKTLPGHTLMEMLVVLALTNIVFGLGYFSWNIIERQLYETSAEEDKLLDINKLRYLLNRDVETCSKIQRTTDGLLLEYQQAPNTQYLFFADGVIRVNILQQDTFYVPTRYLNTFFDQEPVFPGNALVNRISFEVLYEKLQTHWELYKAYPSAELIEKELKQLYD